IIPPSIPEPLHAGQSQGVVKRGVVPSPNAQAEYSHRLAVVLAKSDPIDNLGVVVYPSIPVRAFIVRSLDHFFRFLPEASGARGGDPRSPPSTRRGGAPPSDPN